MAPLKKRKVLDQEDEDETDGAASMAEGTIGQIALKNFMTFGEVTFLPGPGVNVVLGPNGSGKSTLVTAINIGLGGDLKSLGRQRNIGDLVNNAVGANAEASIRIKLNSKKKDKVRGNLDVSLNNVCLTFDFFPSALRYSLRHLKVQRQHHVQHRRKGKDQETSG